MEFLVGKALAIDRKVPRWCMGSESVRFCFKIVVLFILVSQYSELIYYVRTEGSQNWSPFSPPEIIFTMRDLET